MKYRAVLFDFDGTLTPSLPLWIKAFRLALAEFGHQSEDDVIVKRFFYRDWNEAARELGLESYAVLEAAVHRGLLSAFQEAVLFPEVTSILERCRTKGLQTALVTSAPRVVLDDVLPRLGLRSLFSHIVCANDVVNFKPHPEPVLMSLEALMRHPHEAIMVGDSTADILAGKAAGTATALFMTDAHNFFHEAEALRATDPDHIFTRHDELPEILGIE